ncbi:MAG: hypothetical protein HGA30_00640, partial [Anaerolineales bacterium]|nr:hypothetical protein [Anaerolineales bacterium]
MEKNEFEDKWKVIHAQSKAWWSLITDSDLERVDKADSKLHEYLSLLHMKYALDSQTAEAEIASRVKEYEAFAKLKIEA